MLQSTLTESRPAGLIPPQSRGPKPPIFWRKFQRVMGVAMASKNSEGLFRLLKNNNLRCSHRSRRQDGGV